MILRPADLLATLVRRVRGTLARRPQRTRPALTLSPPVASGLRELDPSRYVADFRQPDQVSCGAATLVFSRMVHDPMRAALVISPDDPARRVARWSAEVLAMHRQVSGPRDHDGSLQWPWLRAIGTSPWGAARQMQGGVGRSGLRGTRYTARTLDPDDLGHEFDLIAAATRAGHTVPLYVGTELRPAHVALVVSSEPERLRIYEPSAGRMVRVTRDAFQACAFSLGGWSVPWFAVLPR